MISEQREIYLESRGGKALRLFLFEDYFVDHRALQGLIESGDNILFTVIELHSP